MEILIFVVRMMKQLFQSCSVYFVSYVACLEIQPNDLTHLFLNLTTLFKTIVFRFQVRPRMLFKLKMSLKSQSTSTGVALRPRRRAMFLLMSR